MTSDLVPPKNWVGTPMPRREDWRLLNGRAQYGDDLHHDAYHMAIVRSPHAHAQILDVSFDDIADDPDFVDGFSGAWAAEHTEPVPARAIRLPVVQHIMASTKARYVGEPVAIVIARDPYRARDLADRVQVSYEVLQPVTEGPAAIAPDAPLIFDDVDTNVLVDDVLEHGEWTPADDDIIVEETFKLGRFSSTPLENFVIVAQYDDGNGIWHITANDQQPGRTVSVLASTLRTKNTSIRLQVPDSGGSFGIKLAMWPYTAMAALAARRTGRTIKWVQTRTEHLLCGTHTPDIINTVRLHVSADGRFKRLEVDSLENDGAFIHTAGIYAVIKFATLTGQYRIPSTQVRLRSVVTNLPPVVQNRGVGKPPVSFALERLVELAARQLGRDAIELRRLNLIRPEEMPYETPSGEVYESGDYQRTFEAALDAIDIDAFRARQQHARSEGRYLGLGIANGIEPGTSNIGYYALLKGSSEYLGNSEGATVSIEADGSISARTGSVDSGQGHATTISQVMADAFGMHPDDVHIPIDFDSAVSPFTGHSGVYSNRFNDVDIGALLVAARKVRRKAEVIADHLTGRTGGRWRWADGALHAGDDASVTVPVTDIAAIAYKRVLQLPEGIEPGLREIGFYQNRSGKITNRENFNVQLTHSNSTHVVIAEVDPATGTIELERYVIAHDCGVQLNPLIVEGMLIGSTVHGIGSALIEEFLYDPDGTPVATNFATYRKPVAADIPAIEGLNFETPGTTTLLGSKAAGEGGAITSLAAIANAVEDALRPFEVTVVELPLTPPRVLDMIHRGGGDGA